ncbi:nitroreductase family protein [Pseudonocardia xinjiangensis]|uniref:Nitroreductase family protein n=1 Tax=Pseudonocardia xinjiangensis TaxID=75289 RepID=A0ABX1R7J3_9PSEU|nr:nitroreductase family protein [Pseudonocardia xinjiangensis]NMH76348.1 nitroreductase family protein [Pseudonocardia xinjiangensis]
MEFSEVVRRRRMVRDYDPDRPVPTAIRDRILANALRAPSGGFTQGWAFLTLESPQDRERFWVAAAEDEPDERSAWVLDGLQHAPLLIIPFAHKDAYLSRYAAPDKGWTDRDEARWPMPYWYIDTGMAALLMLQTVVDEGLGACFFGLSPSRVSPVTAEFGVPDGYEPIGVISIGYRAPDTPSPSLKRGRRGAEEVVHHGQWGHH